MRYTDNITKEEARTADSQSPIASEQQTLMPLQPGINTCQ